MINIYLCTHGEFQTHLFNFNYHYNVKSPSCLCMLTNAKRNFFDYLRYQKPHKHYKIYSQIVREIGENCND